MFVLSHEEIRNGDVALDPNLIDFVVISCRVLTQNGLSVSKCFLSCSAVLLEFHFRKAEDPRHQDWYVSRDHVVMFSLKGHVFDKLCRKRKHNSFIRCQDSFWYCRFCL